MSQHSMTLADQAGAPFLADLNNAIQALVGNSSGAAAPSVMFAYQFWADTTNDILKQRNASNTAWISILTMSTGNPLGSVANSTSLTGIGNAAAFDARYILQSNEVTAASDPTFADSSTKVASTNWTRGAMAAIATAAGFASSFAANGYIKFPSWLGGWVVQWGSYTPGVNAGASAVAFPIAFPTACYVGLAGCNATLVGNELLTYSFYPASTTGTNIQYYSSNGTLRASYWIALGK